MRHERSCLIILSSKDGHTRQGMGCHPMPHVSILQLSPVVQGRAQKLWPGALSPQTAISFHGELHISPLMAPIQIRSRAGLWNAALPQLCCRPPEGHCVPAELNDMITNYGKGNAALASLPRKINIGLSPSRDDFPHTHINDVGLVACQHPETGEVRPKAFLSIALKCVRELRLMSPL